MDKDPFTIAINAQWLIMGLLTILWGIVKKAINDLQSDIATIKKDGALISDLDKIESKYSDEVALLRAFSEKRIEELRNDMNGLSNSLRHSIEDSQRSLTHLINQAITSQKHITDLVLKLVERNDNHKG